MARSESTSISAHIPWGDVFLASILEEPADAPLGLVVLAHDAGSPRSNLGHRVIAATLRAGGFATLTFNLQARSERKTSERGFEIELLASRIESAAEWARERPELRGIATGYCGVGTGAAAALIAASEDGPAIGAIVARGGRPDLAACALGNVRAPTLLIVGSGDDESMVANQAAFNALTGIKSLEIVLGADGECTDPATLNLVAESTLTWFRAHLGVAVT